MVNSELLTFGGFFEVFKSISCKRFRISSVVLIKVLKTIHREICIIQPTIIIWINITTIARDIKNNFTFPSEWNEPFTKSIFFTKVQVYRFCCSAEKFYSKINIKIITKKNVEHLRSIVGTHHPYFFFIVSLNCTIIFVWLSCGELQQMNHQ